MIFMKNFACKTCKNYLFSKIETKKDFCAYVLDLYNRKIIDFSNCKNKDTLKNGFYLQYAYKSLLWKR